MNRNALNNSLNITFLLGQGTYDKHLELATTPKIIYFERNAHPRFNKQSKKKKKGGGGGCCSQEIGA